MPYGSLAGLFQGLFGPSGQRLGSGQDEQTFFNLLFSADSDITAYAAGGQAGATVLTAAINNVSTVAAAAASVMLPPALQGMSVVVINGQATNAMQVFGQPTNPNTGVGDTIVGAAVAVPAATATGVSQAASTPAVYYCFAPGQWKQSVG